MVGRFKFRLEVVQRLRKLDQDERKRATAAALRAVVHAESRIVQFTDQLRMTVDRTRGVKQQAEHLDLSQLRSDTFYRGWLQRQILEAHGALAARKQELDVQRLRLGEAAKRLKVIEKLCERQFARHKLQTRRDAQAVDDEAALHLDARRRTEAGDAMRLL